MTTEKLVQLIDVVLVAFRQDKDYANCIKGILDIIEQSKWYCRYNFLPPLDGYTESESITIKGDNGGSYFFDHSLQGWLLDASDDGGSDYTDKPFTKWRYPDPIEDESDTVLLKKLLNARKNTCDHDDYLRDNEDKINQALERAIKKLSNE